MGPRPLSHIIIEDVHKVGTDLHSATPAVNATTSATD